VTAASVTLLQEYTPWTSSQTNCSDQQLLSYHIQLLSYYNAGTTTTNEEAEDSISAEDAREDPNVNDTFAVRRKAAKRILPWDLATGELHLVSPPLQAEDIPAMKKP
jgi:hypothetical protein